MCIMFVWMTNDPSTGGYQLVIASNRDEFYTRPTKPAAIWDQHCISGLDEEPQREGGTWFGVSTHGKVASLLNIASQNRKENERGRGNLARDFLASSESASEYTDKLFPDRHEYGPFHLLLLEKRLNKWKFSYFGNADDKTPRELDTSLIHGFGNCKVSTPWKKVTNGKELFGNLIEKYPSTEDKDELRQSLVELLNDTTTHFPDAQLQSLKKAAAEKFSSIHVKIKEAMYGTRTNTVLLIDADGHGEYFERTLREPIDPNQPIWDANTIQFKLS